MFDLCCRNSKGIINYYILYRRVKTDANFEYKVHRIHPHDASEVYSKRILEFGFSCCREQRVGEDFVMVFTDETGKLEYVFCLCPNASFILCIASALPWCNCFHALLDIIWRNDLYHDTRWPVLQTMLARLEQTSPPPLSMSYVTCPDPFNANRNLKFRIPTSRYPHNLKYVMEYYNSLDTSVWIHVFVCLLLERSILFVSKRLTRLTSCVLAAVSLLYPLQWVHSFYPLIPKEVIQVLECPVPFVAGIHSCNLEAARDHLSTGTCLLDLDEGQLTVFRSPNELQNGRLHECATPKAVYHFLSSQLKEVQHQLGVAMHSKKSKYANWKRVDGETCSFLEQLTKPFFHLIVNLLGCYPNCIVENLGAPEVDVDALIACQSCPSLEPFMRNLCESQTVRLFLDSRARDPPEPNTDLFEELAASLRMKSKPRAQVTSKRTAEDARLRNAAVPIAASVNGLPRPTQPVSYGAPYRYPPPRSQLTNFGSAQWLRSKKVKHPGQLYSWDGLSGNTRNISGSKSSLAPHNWTQKLRAQANTLRNLSRSRPFSDTVSLQEEYLSPGNRSPASLSSESFRDSYRHRSRAETLAVRPSVRPPLPNAPPQATSTVLTDQSVAPVTTSRPPRTAPVDSVALEMATSAYIDSSAMTSKWVTEPHQKQSPLETSAVSLSRTLSVPDSSPALHKQPPPPRPPPPRIHTAVSIRFPPGNSELNRPKESPVPIPSQTTVNADEYNVQRNFAQKENGAFSAPLLPRRSTNLPPRPKPWSPLTRIARSHRQFDPRAHVVNPSDNPSPATNRLVSHSFATSSVTRPFTRTHNTRFVSTTSKADSIRQARLLAEQAGTPPTPPPRPPHRPLCQFISSSYDEQSHSKPPNQKVARCQGTNVAHEVMKLEIQQTGRSSNPVVIEQSAADHPNNEDRCSSLPPPRPPRLNRFRSHTLDPPKIRQLSCTPVETGGTVPLCSYNQTSSDLSIGATPSLPWCRSSSMQNLATGDSNQVSSHPMESSSECRSPIMYMGRQITLRKKYATFSQRCTSVDAVPTYHLHRARTASCKSWRHVPPTTSILQQASQLASKGSAPIAIAESNSGGEFAKLMQSSD